MPFGRGFAAAATLIVIALSCLAIVRRLERERRLLGKLRARSAFDPQRAVVLDELTENEREDAHSLAATGVLSLQQNRCYIRQAELVTFRRKRTRLALSGALGALVLAVVVALLILRR